MHRGGGCGEEDELLAISPPPEFQDFPAPPPTVFRDLSPSTSTGSSTSRITTKAQAQSQRLSEFAARLSFDVLNEAMETVISLSLSHGGYNSRCSATATCPTLDHDFERYPSDSSEEEISITTSWEYLQKPNFSLSGSETRSHRQRLLAPVSSMRGTGPSSNTELPPITSMINRSASFHSDITGGSVVNASRANVRKSESIPHPYNKRNNVASNRHSIAGISNQAADLCYNVPFKNDIYSLPVDDISISTTNPATSSISQTSAARRTVGSNGLISEKPTSTKCCQKNVDDNDGHVRSKPSLLSKHCEMSQNWGQCDESTKVSVCLDFETTKEQGLEDQPEVPTDSHSATTLSARNQTRRSHSVEVKISNVNFHLDTSRLSINSKDRGQVVGSTSTKQEKRTIGHSILNLFKRKSRSKARVHEADSFGQHYGSASSFATTSRALPPPPPPPVVVASDSDAEIEPSVRISCGDNHHDSTSTHMDLGPWSDDESLDGPIEAKDFTVSIEKVKDCGWYWGPLSSEAAEDLLRGEPDGSFIVRDSSDAHYIFSLTFKLNGLVRHVRIEHDQGNFSFGPLTRFKAATIVDFVEKSVAHSRSGRYLFFLHRRPVLGPMRVQLLHPYSRFRHPRSLQHMCRFVILKYVRRDLIPSLPLPKPLQEYCSDTQHYYFEKHEDRKAC